MEGKKKKLESYQLMIWKIYVGHIKQVQKSLKFDGELQNLEIKEQYKV